MFGDLGPAVLAGIIVAIPLVLALLTLVRAWDRESATYLELRIEELERQVQRLERHHPSPYGS